MRVLKVVLPVLALALGLGGFVYLAETRPAPAPGEPEARLWPVDVVAVTVTDHEPVLQVYGEIVAGREADLRTAVAGEVIEAADGFRDGARVDAGALLLRIDPFDYETALAERRAERAEALARLDELRARRALEAEALARDRDILALAERELARRESLFGRGIVADQALDEAREQLLRSRQAAVIRENTLAAEAARIAQQEATIERLAATVRRAERDVERTRITAPFAGLITATSAELGQRLAVNEALARLIDPTRLEARFQLSERQYGRLIDCRDGLVGRPVTVVWQVGEARIETAGTIERIDAEIDMDRGGVGLFARLDGVPPDTPLRPGGFVAVELADCAFRQVVVLPAEAVQPDDSVLLAGDDDRLERRRVAVAARSGDAVVVSGGLAAGERVITNRFTEIPPGALLDPR